MLAPVTFHPGLTSMETPIRLRVLSLGVSVQSTTLALLATHGEVGPMTNGHLTMHSILHHLDGRYLQALFQTTATELILVNLTVDAMEDLMKRSFPDWVLIEREG